MGQSSLSLQSLTTGLQQIDQWVRVSLSDRSKDAAQVASLSSLWLEGDEIVASVTIVLTLHVEAWYIYMRSTIKERPRWLKIKQTTGTIYDTSGKMDEGGDRFERRKNMRILASLPPTTASIGRDQSNQKIIKILKRKEVEWCVGESLTNVRLLKTTCMRHERGLLNTYSYQWRQSWKSS